MGSRKVDTKYKMKEKQFQFGDLVKYNKKLWRFIGMGEDGEITLVRGLDEHAYGCIEFEQVFHDEWNGMKLKEKSEIKDPFPDTIPFESFTNKFCRKKGISKKELLNELIN